MTQLNQSAQNLSRAIATVAARDRQNKTKYNQNDTVHVVGAGRTLTSAYEQLRNAAEYTEEHLLMQRAIRRFYKRLFMTQQRAVIFSSGEELVTELTLGGYLANDTISKGKAKQISKLAMDYYEAHQSLRKSVSTNYDDWTINVLAVEVESLIQSEELRDIFVQFAFDSFSKSIDAQLMFDGNVPSDYELSLYVSIHRMLLKSDMATIRWALLKRFDQDPTKLETYVETNKMIDEVLSGKTSDVLSRLVNRHGASLRILWRTLHEQPGSAALLSQPDKFLAVYETQINTEYQQIQGRIDRGILKAVIFLIITKFIVGVAIEVPYDYIVHGAILWLPLIVNLVWPPLYMVMLRFTLKTPSAGNTASLVEQARQLLCGDDSSKQLIPVNKNYGAAFNITYGMAFMTIFLLVSLGLVGIGFDLMHLLIFFIFFSAASFLGFRLSRTIREIETRDSEQGGVTILRDFIYLPFVVVGQKINEGYSQFNVMAVVLDTVIDLPLKTVLRLVRQWGDFISNKKDEL